jgi:transcriptional regulator with XRE-family HTH domain
VSLHNHLHTTGQVRHHSDVKGHLSPSEWRERRYRLGMSQAAFADLLWCSKRTIIRAENGHSIPHPALQRRLRQVLQQWRYRGLVKTNDLIIHSVDPVKMERALNPPGSDWRHWNWHQRASFWARRKRYQRMIGEQQAGRAMILPR